MIDETNPPPLADDADVPPPPPADTAPVDSSAIERVPPMLPRIYTPAEAALAVWEPDMPENLYHADRSAVSQSALKWLIEDTPMHFYYRWSLQDGDEEDSDAKRIGTLLHLALLEPAQYAARVVVAKKFDRRTKEGKAAAATFEKELPPRAIVVELAEKSQVEAMAMAVLAHPLARDLVQSKTMRKELTGYFTDQATGVKCRIRLDGYETGNAILDLKTTTSCRPADLEKTIHKWRYGLQAATYLDGATLIDNLVQPLEHDQYAWIFVEKAAPYAVSVRFPTLEELEESRAERAAAMATLAECIKTGRWPAYSDNAQPLGRPAWARRKAK